MKKIISELEWRTRYKPRLSRTCSRSYKEELGKIADLVSAMMQLQILWQ